MMKRYAIKWEIAENCNLRCKHCFLGNTKYCCDLSINDYKKIIYKLKARGITYVCLSAKEPFCKPELFDILNIFKSYGIGICINTNGTLIKNDLIEKLYSTSVVRMDISLEGWCENDNDYIRGKGVYEKVVKLLESLEEVNKHKPNKIVVGLSINLTKLNISKINEFLTFYKKFNNLVISFSILSLIGNAMNHEELLITYEEFDHFRNKVLIALNKSESNIVNFSFSSFYGILYYNIIGLTYQQPVIPSCSAFNGDVTVLPNGDICRCSEMIDNPIEDFDNNVGNILESFPRKLPSPLKLLSDYKMKVPCNTCFIKNKCQFCPVAEKGYSLELLLKDCSNYMNQLDVILSNILSSKIEFCVSEKVKLIEEDNKFIIRRMYIGNKSNQLYVDKKTYTSIKLLGNEYKYYKSFNTDLDKKEFRRLFYNAIFRV